jgi:hypothetical protein
VLKYPFIFVLLQSVKEPPPSPISLPEMSVQEMAVQELPSVSDLFRRFLQAHLGLLRKLPPSVCGHFNARKGVATWEPFRSFIQNGQWHDDIEVKRLCGVANDRYRELLNSCVANAGAFVDSCTEYYIGKVLDELDNWEAIRHVHISVLRYIHTTCKILDALGEHANDPVVTAYHAALRDVCTRGTDENASFIHRSATRVEEAYAEAYAEAYDDVDALVAPAAPVPVQVHDPAPVAATRTPKAIRNARKRANRAVRRADAKKAEHVAVVAVPVAEHVAVVAEPVAESVAEPVAVVAVPDAEHVAVVAEHVAVPVAVPVAVVADVHVPACLTVAEAKAAVDRAQAMLTVVEAMEALTMALAHQQTLQQPKTESASSSVWHNSKEDSEV